MDKLIKLILFFLFNILVLSCAGTREQELKKLDKIHGYCDNPMRDFSEIDYGICKDKERAMGPDGKGDEISSFNVTEFIDRVNNGGGSGNYSKPLVNPFMARGT